MQATNGSVRITSQNLNVQQIFVPIALCRA